MISSKLQLFITKQNLPRLYRLCTTSATPAFNNAPPKGESETAKIIKLRREREAREEQTTGYDKAIRINLYHLNMLKKYDTPELNRKRDLQMIKMLSGMIGFFVLVSLGVTAVYWYILKLASRDIFDVEMDFWIPGNPLDRFRERPLPLPKES